MKNVIISGFYLDFLTKPIYELEDNNVINIAKWIIGGAGFDVEHKNKIWWRDIVFNKKFFLEDRSLTDCELKFLLPKFDLFSQNMQREKIFEFYSWYEIRNIIFKFIYYFKNIILAQKVEVVIFSDVPHGPYDLILYYVAKMLKIDTIFGMTSFWIDKTFIYHDLEDIGKFEICSDKRLILERKFQKKLPYMEKKSLCDKLKKQTKIIWDFNNTISEKLHNLRMNKEIYEDFKKYLLLHIERSIKRSIEKNDYKKNYNKYFNDKINNAEKYVYFPLHLQPEMTTDTLGGIYYDQLLAIEKLRNILPDDWYIYVKENPKQTAYMRGFRFFERLSQIKNVRLLNKDVNTYDIMQDCQFVATITGTAGWEAITGGKPALVFGLAWYRYLSGVSIYHDGITVKEILENNIDIVKLERQVYALKYTAYDFYNSCYQKELNICYDYEDHCKNLYIALKKEIGL